MQSPSCQTQTLVLYYSWVMTMKQCIEVAVRFDTDGNMEPVMFWFNGKKYEVDRVIDKRKQAAMIAGATGIRYTCRVLGKERMLWFDDYAKRWFVEIAAK